MKIIIALCAILVLSPFIVQAKPVAAAPDSRAVKSWSELDQGQRDTIVTAWAQLDEVTRPPFPLFAKQWRSNQLGATPSIEPSHPGQKGKNAH